MRRVIALGLVLSVGLVVLVVIFLMRGQPHSEIPRSLWQVYWERKLSRAKERQYWTTRLLRGNIKEAGRLEWVLYVVWVGTAPQCGSGFVADTAQFLGVSHLGSKGLILAWTNKQGTVCRVAVLSESSALSSSIVPVARALLGTHRDAYPAFVQAGEVLSLVNHRTWLRDGRLTWGSAVKPLQNARKFGRIGTWPGVYYIYDEHGNVLEVGFFFS